MDIAIQMQPIYLGEERVLFRTVGLLKGKYDEKKDIFTDEYGYEYSRMNGTNLHADRYFYFAAPLDRLREAYEGLSEVEMLTDLLYNFMERFYIGEFNVMSGTIDLIEYNWDHIEEDLANLKEEQQSVSEEVVEFDPNDNEKFTFDLKSLKALRDMQTVDEIRDFLDKLIGAGEYIKEVNNKKVSENASLQPKEEKKYKLDKKGSQTFNLKKLRQTVLENIIGQDEAVYDLTRVIAINKTSKDPKNKSHILVTGPSGTGKTEIVNIIAKELDMPTFKADATSYSKTGYKGKDVQEMILGLITAANGDIEKAQNGILIIDEIDKTVSYQDDKGFGKSVLYALLKILDRDIIEVDLDLRKEEKVLFDTSNLTVILMGSFDELYEQKQQNKKVVIGFNSEIVNEESKVRLDEEDLIKWMGPELIGRVGKITSTDELTHKNVLRILKESKISQLTIAKKDLENRGVKLICTPGYLNAVAEQGYSKKLGVRKLNKEVKKSLDCAYDEILTNENVKVLKLTKKTAMDNKEYYVEY